MTRPAKVGRPLKVDHLTKIYSGNTVVDDLTFVVPPGRVTGFLGPNGSGKSTAMKLMLDLAEAAANTFGCWPMPPGWITRKWISCSIRLGSPTQLIETPERTPSGCVNAWDLPLRFSASLRCSS